MKRLYAPVLAVLALSLVLAVPMSAQERYDVVIRNGRVMDPETGLDAIRNVGINGQTIVAISEDELDGERIINAEGLVVAPGFIDLHAHGQTNRANEFQARDGVTTALELESGVPSLAGYLGQRSGDAIINYGATVNLGTSRVAVMPQFAALAAEAQRIAGSEDEDDQARLTELQWELMAGNYENLPKDLYPELHERIRQGMAEGALGIGMAHQYYPGASHDEIFHVFELAGAEGYPIYTHVRSMGIQAVQEVLANAMATSAPLHIVHLNSSSLGDIGTNLALVKGAQEAGVDVTTEVYPYTAASTSLQSAIFDEGFRERLGIDYSDIQWQDTGERLTEETFHSYREQGGVVIIHMMREEWIQAALEADHVMVASDGMPYAAGAHPRSAGTFSRFLGRYVRDMGTVSLMNGLRKITLMPAQRLEAISAQAARKGRVQIGADADLTIFDPNRILDTATFEDDLSFSVGVQHVLVNGVLVVQDGENVEGVRPGQAVVGRKTVF